MASTIPTTTEVRGGDQDAAVVEYDWCSMLDESDSSDDDQRAVVQVQVDADDDDESRREEVAERQTPVQAPDDSGIEMGPWDYKPPPAAAACQQVLQNEPTAKSASAAVSYPMEPAIPWQPYFYRRYTDLTDCLIDRLREDQLSAVGLQTDASIVLAKRSRRRLRLSDPDHTTTSGSEGACGINYVLTRFLYFAKYYGDGDRCRDRAYYEVMRQGARCCAHVKTKAAARGPQLDEDLAIFLGYLRKRIERGLLLLLPPPPKRGAAKGAGDGPSAAKNVEPSSFEVLALTFRSRCVAVDTFRVVFRAFRIPTAAAATTDDHRRRRQSRCRRACYAEEVMFDDNDEVGRFVDEFLSALLALLATRRGRPEPRPPLKIWGQLVDDKDESALARIAKLIDFSVYAKNRLLRMFLSSSAWSKDSGIYEYSESLSDPGRGIYADVRSSDHLRLLELALVTRPVCPRVRPFAAAPAKTAAGSTRRGRLRRYDEVDEEQEEEEEEDEERDASRRIGSVLDVVVGQAERRVPCPDFLKRYLAAATAKASNRAWRIQAKDLETLRDRRQRPRTYEIETSSRLCPYLDSGVGASSRQPPRHSRNRAYFVLDASDDLLLPLLYLLCRDPVCRLSVDVPECLSLAGEDARDVCSRVEGLFRAL